MSVSNTAAARFYSGNGSNKDFPINMSFQVATEIKVYKRSLAGVETLLQEGAMLDYTLTGAAPPFVPLPTTVSFITAPLATDTIVIVRELALTQPEVLSNAIAPDLKAIERELDRTVLQVQQLDRRIDRAPLLPLSIQDMLVFPIAVDGEASFIAYDTDGNLVTKTVAEIGGGFGFLGTPDDGGYGSGTPAGPVTGITVDDTLENAFDKVETIFEKLAPAKPPLLAAAGLSIAGSYAALESGTGTARPVTIDSTSPAIITPATGAFDGAAGTLVATLDAAPVGTIALTPASDVGSNGLLQILLDFDYYFGVAGKANFWYVFQARINAAALALGIHTASLAHSSSGSTANLSFAVDDPGVPTISSTSVVGSGTTQYISGVPGLAAGATITANFTVGNAVRAHYNATAIASASSGQTNSVSAPLPGSPPANGASIVASIALTVQSSAYSENVTVNAIGRNSKGATASVGITSGNVRVDTVSSETNRKKSGTGQFPTQGTGGTQFGDTWVATALLSSNKELQALNGAYQYPALTDYSGNLPVAGPNNTGLTADSFNSNRWATFLLGSKTNVTSVTITVNGGVNLGATALISGLDFQVLIEGATGWVDGNAAYPGVGNPSTNGDAALDVGGSTVSSRRITFGATPRTGNVWCRVGIPSGSSKKFASLTLV